VPVSVGLTAEQHHPHPDLTATDRRRLPVDDLQDASGTGLVEDSSAHTHTLGRGPPQRLPAPLGAFLDSRHQPTGSAEPSATTASAAAASRKRIRQAPRQLVDARNRPFRVEAVPLGEAVQCRPSIAATRYSDPIFMASRRRGRYMSSYGRLLHVVQRCEPNLPRREQHRVVLGMPSVPAMSQLSASASTNRPTSISATGGGSTTRRMSATICSGDGPPSFWYLAAGGDRAPDRRLPGGLARRGAPARPRCPEASPGKRRARPVGMGFVGQRHGQRQRHAPSDCR